MSLRQTRFLLQEHQIVPNKVLGQNFIVDSSIFSKLSCYSSLNLSDVVLDVGAGFGFLTQFMSKKCKAVVAIEKDLILSRVLREKLQGVKNLTIVEGDLFAVDVPFFNKVVSIPPYYLSSRLLIWLLDRFVECSVLVVQKEFAERLIADVESEEYGWLGVATYQFAKVELFDIVPKSCFYPQPKVDSVIVRLKPWVKPPFKVTNVAFFRRMLRWLFTQRNKKMGNAVIPFIRKERNIDKNRARQIALALPLRGKRVRELSQEDFGVLADALFI
jgi:16S rRNA (adenine1518-N6/adenine1519-N6)-dimethyltransferase